VDLVCVTPVGGGMEILGQQRILERDMNARRSSRPPRRRAGGGDNMRRWVDGRLKDSFPLEAREAAGGGMEAGVRGEGRRWAQGEEDYAMAAVEGDIGGQRGLCGRVRPSKARQGESREEKVIWEVVPRRIDIQIFCYGITAIPLVPMYKLTYGSAAVGSGQRTAACAIGHAWGGEDVALVLQERGRRHPSE
jgi:hypothetical protein